MRRSEFFDALRRPEAGLFAGSLTQDQVAGIEGILDAMQVVGDNRCKTLAYALATAYHETGRKMVPVREGFAASDEAAIRAVAALARKRGPGSAPSRYGQPTGPHSKAYYGRGHVQLTWRENYARSSEDAGVDLERDPDAMLDPVVSARILIKGLIDGRWNGARRGIAHYLPDRGDDDLKDARRTVNGTDRWDAIAGYYKAFLAAIEAGGGWSAEPVEAEEPAPAESVPEPAHGASLEAGWPNAPATRGRLVPGWRGCPAPADHRPARRGCEQSFQLVNGGGLYPVITMAYKMPAGGHRPLTPSQERRGRPKAASRLVRGPVGQPWSQLRFSVVPLAR